MHIIGFVFTAIRCFLGKSGKHSVQTENYGVVKIFRFGGGDMTESSSRKSF